MSMSNISQEHQADDEHQDVPSDFALRVKSLESLLLEKGLARARMDPPSTQCSPAYVCALHLRGAHQRYVPESAPTEFPAPQSPSELESSAGCTRGARAIPVKQAYLKVT